MAKLPTPTYEQAWAAYHKAREAFTAADLAYLDARKEFARNTTSATAVALGAARTKREAADAALRAAEKLLQGV